MITIASTRKKFFRVAEIIHLRIFGHEMGAEMRKFLGHLSWSFFGGVIAAAIMFAVNIIAGRWLGPEEYGKYSLVFLLSQIFLIPMVFGMDMAISRAISKRAHHGLADVQRDVSSAFWLVLLSMGLFSLILVIGKSFFAGIFATTINIVIFGLLLSLVLALKTFLDGIVRGLQLFQFQAKVRIFEASFSVAVFFGAYSFLKSYVSIALAFVFAGAIVVFRYLFCFRRLIFSIPNSTSLKGLLSYSKFVVGSALVTLVVGYGDRFVVNKYFGTEELGLYSAYYAATIFVIGQITVIMSNVFFPVIAKIKEKVLIVKKIDRLVFFGFIPSVFLLFFVGLAVLTLFGPAYKINILVLSLFSVVATLQFFVAFYGNMVAAHSKKTYFLGLKFYFFRACAYIGYIIILVAMDLLSVQTILLGLIMNYAVDGAGLRYILKKYC